MSRSQPSPGRRRILVDTSAYFALTDQSDHFHAEALAIATQLSAQRYQHFTTSFLFDRHFAQYGFTIVSAGR